MEDQVEQVQGLSKELTDPKLNWRPDEKRWSSGQIFEHMILAAAPYADLMKHAIASARRSSADAEVFHTWFGRVIIRGAGPSGNVPVPKPLIPGSGPYKSEIIDRWIALHQELIQLAHEARGIDLSAIPMRSPFIKLFKMNLADFFEVLAGHAERHVGQIEKLHREMRATVP